MKQDEKKVNGLWLTAAIAGAAFAGLAALRLGRRMEFSGKIALVTGGSRGLGLLLARRLAAAGASVALCARSADDLEKARIDLQSRGIALENIFLQVCDVADAAQVKQTVAAVIAHFGGLDILVNNAGIIQVGPQETQTDADYEKAFAVHFWGPRHFIEAALPTLKARRGRIVNIASIGGIVHFPHLSPYGTSKAALIAYSQGLRAELQQFGVLVTTVAPGLIRTGSPKNALFKGQHKAEYTWFALSDSIPGVSQSADTAADQIIHALRFGDAFLVTSIAGQIGALASGVLPGLTADALALVNQFLPGADGPQSVGTETRTGGESETPVTQSVLTTLTQKAAQANNE